MTTRLLVQIVTAVVIAVFAVGILATGGEVQFGWLRFYAIAVLGATATLFTWDRLLWRTPLLQRFKAVPRDLRGTWVGTLESFWVDPKTGECPPVKTVYLIVRQTASEVSAVLLTDESRSVSTFARVSDDGVSAALDYMYLNRPDSRVEHRSRMHHGSTSLDLIGRPVTRMAGRYWTSRDSKGELDFTLRHKTRVDGFPEAIALFSSSPDTEQPLGPDPPKVQLPPTADPDQAAS